MLQACEYIFLPSSELFGQIQENKLVSLSVRLGQKSNKAVPLQPNHLPPKPTGLTGYKKNQQLSLPSYNSINVISHLPFIAGSSVQSLSYQENPRANPVHPLYPIFTVLSYLPTFLLPTFCFICSARVPGKPSCCYAGSISYA